MLAKRASQVSILPPLGNSHKKVIKPVIVLLAHHGTPLGAGSNISHIRNSMKHNEITEEALTRLVETFYARVRQDPLIGPVFNRAVHDWDEHLPKLQAFWSSIMLGSGRYKGQPMPAHVRHGDAISPASFERWLQLWHQTTSELFASGPAEALQSKAERIAESLSLGIAFHRGRGLDPAAAALL